MLHDSTMYKFTTSRSRLYIRYMPILFMQKCMGFETKIFIHQNTR